MGMWTVRKLWTWRWSSAGSMARAAAEGAAAGGAPSPEEPPRGGDAWGAPGGCPWVEASDVSIAPTAPSGSSHEREPPSPFPLPRPSLPSLGVPAGGRRQPSRPCLGCRRGGKAQECTAFLVWVYWTGVPVYRTGLRPNSGGKLAACLTRRVELRSWWSQNNWAQGGRARG